MSNGQGHGGSKPPHDDRTLLDPLSNDELRALREARQRLQAKKESSGSAVAHQIVIGPDGGDDIGDAPTRAMPSLPTFEGNVSLDQISAPPQQRMTGTVQDPALMAPTQLSAAPGPTPSDPMSVVSHADTVAPSNPPMIQGRPLMPPPSAGPHGAPGNVPPPGQPGFGENTLLWMQPPKAAPTTNAGPTTGTMEFIPRANPKDIALGRLKAYGAIGFVLLLMASLVYLSLFSAPKGFIELHSTPLGAAVYIDGDKYQKTPVKLTLSEGAYRISLKLEGYETAWFNANVKAEQSERRDIPLVPISRPGLMTVKIEVQPVAAKIVVDGQVHDGKKTLMVPNVDPLESHKIVVEAQGYVKIIQEVRADELKSSYSFVLAKSSE